MKILNYQLDYLGANLMEIYAALEANPQAENASKLSLYPDCSSNVYFEGSVAGQVKKIWDKTWKWFQKSNPSISLTEVLEKIVVWSFDFSVRFVYDLRQKRICNCIRQVDGIFKENLESDFFQEQCERFSNYLLQELEGSNEAKNSRYLNDFKINFKKALSESDEKSFSRSIIKFHQSTSFFWPLLLKNKEKYQKKRRLLLPLVKSESSTIRDRKLYDALKKELHWIQLEGIMQEKVPVGLLAKLGDPKSLSENEKMTLKLWVETLNQCRESISAKLLISVLQEAINIIAIQGSSQLTLGGLLVWLEGQQCGIVLDDDLHHMEWRRALSEGGTITCNGIVLALGKTIGPNKQLQDNFKVFELKDYPDYVVKIARSRTRLLMDANKSMNEEEHWGVRLVETIPDIRLKENGFPVSGLDCSGVCAVMEKLSDPIDKYTWESQAMELNENDEELALILANHFFCMSQWKGAPEKLSMSHLMRNKEGILKSTRLLKKGPPDYNKWEAYCVDAARGNSHVLNFLMRVSKLSEHKIAVYYQEAVAHVFQTGKIDLIGRKLPLGHNQKVYDTRAEQLCERALEVRKNCLEIVLDGLSQKKNSTLNNPKQIEKAVSEMLVKYYLASPTPGILPDNFEQIAADHYLENSSLDEISLSSRYFQKMHEKMMRLNKDSTSEIEFLN